MKRGWFLLLCVSLGFNAAFLFVTLTGHAPGRAPADVPPEDPARFLHHMMESHWRDGAPGAPHGGRRGPREGDLRGGRVLGPEPGDRGLPPGEASDSLLHMRLHYLGRLLNLDEGQRAGLEAVMSDQLPDLLAARMRVFDVRREIFEIIGQNELHADRVRALVQDLSQAQARLDSIMAESILREAEYLTPEQREGYFHAMPWNRPGSRCCGKRESGTK